MGMIGQSVVRTGGMGLWLAEQMLKDVKPEQFARKPVVGGKVIETNHPAFVYGHLATYPAKLLGMLGLDASAAAAPEGFDELFSAGKECRDDPEGTIYPPMETITGAFFRGYKALFEQLPEVPDAKFADPTPLEGRIKAALPTMADLTPFLGCAHIMMHMGQMSAWRRCVGLGSAM